MQYVKADNKGLGRSSAQKSSIQNNSKTYYKSSRGSGRFEERSHDGEEVEEGCVLIRRNIIRTNKSLEG